MQKTVCLSSFAAENAVRAPRYRRSASCKFPSCVKRSPWSRKSIPRCSGSSSLTFSAAIRLSCSSVSPSRAAHSMPIFVRKNVVPCPLRSLHRALQAPSPMRLSHPADREIASVLLKLRLWPNCLHRPQAPPTGRLRASGGRGEKASPSVQAAMSEAARLERWWLLLVLRERGKAGSRQFVG